MLNLAEYRRKDTRLADYLPWACLVAPGVVLNKDGSFQRTFRYRGPDLDSATPAELVAVTARLNNIVKRFGDGWALFFEAERTPAHGYPPGRFADPASWLVDLFGEAPHEGAGLAGAGPVREDEQKPRVARGGWRVGDARQRPLTGGPRDDKR